MNHVRSEVHHSTGRYPEPVCDLIREGARRVVSTRRKWFAELLDYTLSSEYMQTIVNDPVAVEAVDRAHQSNQVHWAAANVSHPGEPVPPNLSPEALGIARYLVRRGLDEAAVVEMYRAAQSFSLRAWMQTAFQLTSNPDQMRELFVVSERSITSFLGGTIAGIHQQMHLEREELTRGTHAERREAIALVLDGAPIARQRVEERLGYRLDQEHTAAVIWGDESSTDLSDLDRAAETLMGSRQQLRPLSLLVSAATRWLWIPGSNTLDLTAAAACLSQLRPDIRIAVGPTSTGLEGFRRSHLDAITTQRVMARLGSAQRIASFADVQLVALITAEPEQADSFVNQTLGGFAHAEPELQQTVLTFIQQQCSASRAAETLFTHRNTVLRRVARANELLPRPLDGTSVHVAAALEVLRWRDAPGLSAGHR